MTNKWIYCEEWWEGLTKFVTHCCPYCDCEVSNRKNDDLPDYCPNCGAKMEDTMTDKQAYEADISD